MLRGINAEEAELLQVEHLDRIRHHKDGDAVGPKHRARPEIEFETPSMGPSPRKRPSNSPTSVPERRKRRPPKDGCVMPPSMISTWCPG